MSHVTLCKSDPAFADKIRHIRDPKKRMAVVWAHCKTKMTCEPDDPKDEGADMENEEPKKGHGGCGHVQPLVRKEGLKLFVQYKKPKDDDDVRTTHSDNCMTLTTHPRRSNLFSPTSGYSLLLTSTRHSRRCPIQIYILSGYRMNMLDQNG